jgi:hypothetical protein
MDETMDHYRPCPPSRSRSHLSASPPAWTRCGGGLVSADAPTGSPRRQSATNESWSSSLPPVLMPTNLLDGLTAAWCRDGWAESGAAPRNRISVRAAPPRHLEPWWNSVRARSRAFQHLWRQQARLESTHHPAPSGGPEGLAAGAAAEALVRAAGGPWPERLPAPRTPGRHRSGSRRRTPGPPPRSMNLTPACSSARRSAARMARRGSVAPRSNCRSVTSPTSADRARSPWVQSSNARAARHWLGVTTCLYHKCRFPSTPLINR